MVLPDPPEFATIASEEETEGNARVAELNGQEHTVALERDDEIPESQDVSEEGVDTPQGFRQEAVKEIPSGPGVYALCDLDGVPLYVGQSVDGIQARVRRHLTSARSDIIANRMIDIWEVASVRCWEVRPARISWAKFRDAEIGVTSWRQKTSQILQELTAQHAKELTAFTTQLAPDLNTAEKRERIKKLRADLKDAKTKRRKERDEELKRQKAEFESRSRADWEAARKAETLELKALNDPLEAFLYSEYNKQKLLMNAKVLEGDPQAPPNMPDPKTVRVMKEDVRTMRRIESLRLSRQANHFTSLLDHILNVKNNHILRVALNAHYQRLSDYCKKFVGDAGT
jgi:hypothetical protein